jgi:hypothetical protein
MKHSEELDRIMLMLKAVPDNTIIGSAIKQSFINNSHPVDIIAWLKSQAQDCPPVMARVLGDQLTNDILKFLS